MATVENDVDPLNLNTYQWAEWTIFTIVVLGFGCLCLCMGICLQNWRLRELLLMTTEENIGVLGRSPKNKRKSIFQAQISGLMSPRGTVARKVKGPMSSQDSVIMLGTPPSGPVNNRFKNTEMAKLTPSVSSLNVSQINKLGLVGQSIQKVSIIDEEEAAQYDAYAQPNSFNL